MRGLKPVNMEYKKYDIVVASFTDAWIETSIIKGIEDSLLSHLLQMRGLKPSLPYKDTARQSRIFYRCVD